MIRIRSLQKFFNKGKQNEIHVIDDITLDLPERGMVAIFGRSGCGKTTLLNVIGGLDGFESGMLTVDGKDIRKNTDETRNRYIGYIFQNYNLQKEQTCYENVASALYLCGMTDETAIDARVTAALKNVGMEKYAKRTPDTLSGGQQQRVAIARAIVKNPHVILADEPTGNLDEANTVMIMDLLKRIAKDHLVLLVTHEEDLVDYYCDKVIEISDGKVVGMRDNHGANGYAARDKNDIFLGELEKRQTQTEEVCVDYYGDASETPVKLRIVRYNGKRYLRVDSPDVQVLDETSEIRLREGKYRATGRDETDLETFDTSALSPVKGEKFGRLFRFRSALRSGYFDNFKKGKKGKKFFRACMVVFAAAIVFMAATFGTAFADLANAKKSYNHNTFYVYTDSAATSEKLLAAVGDETSGIDHVHLNGRQNPTENGRFSFVPSYFESFDTASMYWADFSTNAVYLEHSVIKGELLKGKKTDLADDEAVITSAVADALLSKASLGYLTEYADLIGMRSKEISAYGKDLTIVGIVKSSETAVYVSPLALATHALAGNKMYYGRAEKYGLDVKKGETIVTIMGKSDLATFEYPKLGDTVKIHGIDLTVSRFITYARHYAEWLSKNDLHLEFDATEYFKQVTQTEYPDLDVNSVEFDEKFGEISNERWYEWVEYYYAYFDEYLTDKYMFECSFHTFLAVVKGDFASLVSAAESDEYATYYRALKYKKDHGGFPTMAEILSGKVLEGYPTCSDDIDKLPSEEYLAEYQATGGTPLGVHGNFFYVSDEDYISFSKQIGETHPVADYAHDYGYEIPDGYIVDELRGQYTLVHSVDPKKTEAFLKRTFSYVETGDESLSPIFTPDDFYRMKMSEIRPDVIGNFVALACVTALMSLCMYFIMRSSLLTRVKEVGIYRAIGVSKKNLIFKFAVESLVVVTMTVFLGYLLASAFVSASVSGVVGGAVGGVFYYPVWYAVLLLAFLYGVCLLCGVLPVWRLLRKTPGEILAKYDI